MQKLSEKTVLTYLAMRMQVSLPDLVKHVGMPASTVVGILSRLGKKGLVARGESLAGGRGRPLATYRLMLPQPVAVCQFDGTQLVGAILDQDFQTKAFKKIDLGPVETLDEAIEILRQILGHLEHEAGILGQELSGLALSINAVRRGNRVLMSSVLPWANEATEETFTTKLGMPVRLVTVPAVLAEYQNFSGPAPRSMVLFRVADGVSANFMVFGRAYRGHTQLAGELGHVIADPAGPLCGCGRRGCLEALCSGPAIYKHILDELESGVACALDRMALQSLAPRKAMEEIWKAWKAGDSYLRAVMEQVFDRLGWGLGLVINLNDPEHVAMGGYVLANKPEWIEEVIRRAQRWILHSGIRTTKFEESRVTGEDELRVIGSSFYYGTGTFKRAEASSEDLARPSATP
jgi:predicted NBD/HSP70 family sugar kinase